MLQVDLNTLISCWIIDNYETNGGKCHPDEEPVYVIIIKKYISFSFHIF